MIAYDVRGDASRGDFDGVSAGTIANTFGVPAAIAKVKSTASAVASAPGGSLIIGLAVLIALIVYTHRRLL